MKRKGVLVLEALIKFGYRLFDQYCGASNIKARIRARLCRAYVGKEEGMKHGKN